MGKHFHGSGRFIKIKHVKLGKPDTQEHYPNKGEGTPAIPYGKMFLTVL